MSKSNENNFKIIRRNNDNKQINYEHKNKHNHEQKYEQKHINNKIKIAKSILPDDDMTNIIPSETDNPFTITLPSATGQLLNVGDLVIIVEQQANKFSSGSVSVFTKITKESYNFPLVGIVQFVGAHNLTTASFGGLINYLDQLKPAKNYYLCDDGLTENSINKKQTPNRFMGTATSTNKILWMPEK